MYSQLLLVWVHRTVRWCTGQCPVRQTSLGEQATLGTRWRRTAINHRTVRWCTGLSGESSAAKSSLSGNVQRRTAKIHRTVRWCTGLSGDPTVGRAIRARRVGAPTVGRGHRTVRCANCHESATVVCARKGRRSRTGQLQGLSGGASDCPVRHLTEGKILPSKNASNGS
jgi:hypothetical protein